MWILNIEYMWMLINVPRAFLVTGFTEAIAAEGDTDGQMVPP